MQMQTSIHADLPRQTPWIQTSLDADTLHADPPNADPLDVDLPRQTLWMQTPLGRPRLARPPLWTEGMTHACEIIT